MMPNIFFGYFNEYIYELIDRIYYKYGTVGLRSKIKHIIQYLIFLFNKLKKIHNMKVMYWYQTISVYTKIIINIEKKQIKIN